MAVTPRADLKVGCDAAVQAERYPVAEFKAAAERYIDLIESAGKPVPKKTRPKARRVERALRQTVANLDASLSS